MLEVFNNLFMSIAEQMGVVLQNTSYSVNIETARFSCAIFDSDGQLVANAAYPGTSLDEQACRLSLRTRRSESGRCVRPQRPL